MKKHTSKIVKARRDFLRAGAAAGAGATIAAALPGAASAVEPEAGRELPNEKYRVTKHVADYYKTLS
ncbi:MAG: twin-arginine translocation signal domain-containing protein [Gammaproteobacteria bacterium]|nr:twin-arginine translocation signal domain-containing protein [Gammaproteobacteria bacterium]